VLQHRQRTAEKAIGQVHCRVQLHLLTALEWKRWTQHAHTVLLFKNSPIHLSKLPQIPKRLSLWSNFPRQTAPNALE